MRILVTGIQGVLGSVLAKELRHRGHAVYGCGLVHSSDRDVVRADIAKNRQLHNVLDIFDGPSFFNPTVEGLDIIFNFAGEFGRLNGNQYYEDLWTSNV